MEKDAIDRSVKVLARRYPRDFAGLLLGDSEGITAEIIENPEVNIPQRRGDFIWVIKRGEERAILHAEFQLAHLKAIPRRVFAYNAFYSVTYDLPTISAVLYLERRHYRRLPAEYVARFGGRGYNAFSYRVIKLWDHVEDIISGELRAFAPLLILASEEKSIEAVEMARELISQEKDIKRRADALSVAMMVAERYLDREALLRLFRGDLDMLVKESSFVQDWINEGIKRGVEQGIEKGIEKGEVSALRNAILDVLEERFGSVGKDVRGQLQAIKDPGVLKSLHRKSIRVGSVDEFQAEIIGTQ